VTTSAASPASFGVVLASGLTTLAVAALVAIPTSIVALLFSFSGGGGEWVVYAIALVIVISVGTKSFARSLRRRGAPATEVFALIAITTLVAVLVVVGYLVVSIVGVIIGPAFVVLLAAEVAVVLVWAIGVTATMSRRSPHSRARTA
jgi:hypothetical protein